MISLKRFRHIISLLIVSLSPSIFGQAVSATLLGTYARRFFAQCSWVLAVLMFASVASIVAQQTTGSIVGTVKDQTGAVVNTATVKATNVETGFSRSAPTNGYGEYRIDYLPVGRYTVEWRRPALDALCNRISSSTWTRR